METINHTKETASEYRKWPLGHIISATRPGRPASSPQCKDSSHHTIAQTETVIEMTLYITRHSQPDTFVSSIGNRRLEFNHFINGISITTPKVCLKPPRLGNQNRTEFGRLSESAASFDIEFDTFTRHLFKIYTIQRRQRRCKIYISHQQH